MDFCKELKQYHDAHPLLEQTVMGTAFPYRLLGSGEKTMVFMPGAMMPSDGYFRHLTEFAKEFQVLTFDYPAGFITNAAMADAVAVLMERLSIVQAVFVGQSYGGFLAQILAVRHPGKVAALVLSNTGTLYESMNEDGKADLHAMVRSFKKFALLLRFVPVSFFLKKLLKKALAHTEEMPEDEKAYYRELHECLYRRMTRKSTRQLFALMADLENVPPMRLADFEFLAGKTLLLMSPDDNTFNDGIIRGLIDMMSEPRISGELSGGHTAPLFSRETYVRLVGQFIQSL
ncbi:MAG: alpha/beta fold hydrolase [Christensenellales bacterium]